MGDCAISNGIYTYYIIYKGGYKETFWLILMILIGGFILFKHMFFIPNKLDDCFELNACGVFKNQKQLDLENNGNSSVPYTGL